MIHRAFKGYFLALALVIAVALPSGVSAFTKTTLPVENLNDFVLEPGKVEIFGNPGETVTKTVSVTSRIDHSVEFDLSIEDFKGSDSADQPVVLLGSERGPHSLKDFIKGEIDSFGLEFGERITIPVTITIPADAEPGGYYGAVIISNKPSKIPPGGVSGTVTQTVSRVGVLFLVRVNGDAKEEGELQDFKMIGGTKKISFDKGPDGFEILFHNSGNVHLVPHGLITIKNTVGKAVAGIPVDAYFSLPDSTRYRELQWKSGFLLGRYTASLDFYPGYGSTNQTRVISFWVLPLKVVLPVALVVILLSCIIYFTATRFEFRRRS